VFQVIDNHQQVGLMERLSEAILGRQMRVLGHTECLDEGVRQQGRIAERSEIDEGRAVGKTIAELTRHLQG
jgi:hypothetical protein